MRRPGGLDPKGIFDSARYSCFKPKSICKYLAILGVSRPIQYGDLMLPSRTRVQNASYLLGLAVVAGSGYKQPLWPAIGPACPNVSISIVVQSPRRGRYGVWPRPFSWTRWTSTRRTTKSKAAAGRNHEAEGIDHDCERSGTFALSLRWRVCRWLTKDIWSEMEIDLNREPLSSPAYQPWPLYRVFSGSR